MNDHKIKSFTLPELLVVMVLTAIVVGLAFSILRLVQKQIYSIQNNYEKTSTLSLFEQKLNQDFNEFHHIEYLENSKDLIMSSEMDTIQYHFEDNFITRENDTIALKLKLSEILYNGKSSTGTIVDAISISAVAEIPNYEIFISKKNDLTYAINQENGL